MMKGAERKNLLGALGIGWAGRVMKGEGVGEGGRQNGQNTSEKKPVAAVE